MSSSTIFPSLSTSFFAFGRRRNQPSIMASTSAMVLGDSQFDASGEPAERASAMLRVAPMR